VSRAARDASFGFFLVPNAADYPDLLRQVAAAERCGLDLIGIQDHPYQRRYLDTFALIGDLLARTERLRFFPDVANLPLRPPATLAKLAASLDVMSDGRSSSAWAPARSGTVSPRWAVPAGRPASRSRRSRRRSS
jgi:alkanesulfonate monooxygenase SsuD/methylene tetrahydromethanopterin reductase-like flavin-dependent oxidoreductase (luciferase family)